jgi:hypothetical protein
MLRLREGAFSDLVRARFSNQLGVDLQNEVLPALGGRVTMVTRVQRPIRLNSEATAVGVKLKDGEAFQKVLEKVVAKFPDALERQSYGATTYYRIRMPTPPQDQNQELIRQPEPALVLLGDYLIASDSVKFIEQCVITKSSPDASLAADLEFKLVASRVQRHAGGRQPALIAFQRPEENLRALYELATAEATRQQLSRAAGENPFFRALDGALTKNPLPPFDVIARYLAPSGAMLISDETGFHYIAFGLKRD